MWRPRLEHLLQWSLAGTFLALSSTQCAPPDAAFELPPNFHVVDRARTYRSAQPSAAQLEAAINRHGIRTVLNLRGPNAGKAWYDAEAAVCAARGVRLADYPMSAGSLPPPDVLKGVIETLKTAEYPLLLHCSGGADRSGLVSAVYRMLILDHPRQESLEELSPEYLHFRAFNPCMDTLAELYEPTDDWLEWYAANRDTITCR